MKEMTMTQDPLTLHRFLTTTLLRSTLQGAGYRVTETTGPNGEPVLASATNGLGFEVRLFNALTPARAGDEGAKDAFADAGLRTAFRVEGELPLALVNHWNATHRFARLLLAGEWLVFEMDMIVLGGVLADNLRAQIEIWDRLIVELIGFLRAELPKLARPAPVAEPTPAETPVPEADVA